jgi:hypothetical protein
MPSPRSDPFRQLQRLLRLEDVDDEVRAHVIANLAVLAPLLGARADQLEEAAQHEDFPRRLRRHLVGLRAREREQRDVDAVAISKKVAAALGVAMRWRGEVAHLDVSLLLDAGLTCTAVGYVRFVAEGYAVPITRGTLVDLRRHLPRFPDLGAYVDEQGLHLRWRGGRGQLNFRPQVIVGRVEVLDVVLERSALPVIVAKPTRSNNFADADFGALGLNM